MLSSLFQLKKILQTFISLQTLFLTILSQWRVDKFQSRGNILVCDNPELIVTLRKLILKGCKRASAHMPNKPTACTITSPDR